MAACAPAAAVAAAATKAPNRDSIVITTTERCQAAAAPAPTTPSKRASLDTPASAKRIGVENTSVDSPPPKRHATVRDHLESSRSSGHDAAASAPLVSDVPDTFASSAVGLDNNSDHETPGLSYPHQPAAQTTRVEPFPAPVAAEPASGSTAGPSVATEAEAAEGNPALRGSAFIRQQVYEGNDAISTLAAHANNTHVNSYSQLCQNAAVQLERTTTFVFAGASETGCTTICNRLAYPEGEGKLPLPRGPAPPGGSHVVFQLKPDAESKQFSISLRFCEPLEQNKRLQRRPTQEERVRLADLTAWRGAYPAVADQAYETVDAMKYIHKMCKNVRKEDLAVCLDAIVITGPFAHCRLPVAFIDIPGTGNGISNALIASLCEQYVLVTCSHRLAGPQDLWPVVDAYFSTKKTVMLVNAFFSNDSDDQPELRDNARHRLCNAIDATCADYLDGLTSGHRSTQWCGGGEPGQEENVQERMQDAVGYLHNLRYSCDVLLANHDVAPDRLSKWVDDVVCTVYCNGLSEFTAGIANALAFTKLATTAPAAAPAVKRALKHISTLATTFSKETLVVVVGNGTVVGRGTAGGGVAGQAGEGNDTSGAASGSAPGAGGANAAAGGADGAAASDLDSDDGDEDDEDDEAYAGEPNVSRLARHLADAIHTICLSGSIVPLADRLPGELERAVSYLPCKWLSASLLEIVNLIYANVTNKVAAGPNRRRYVQATNRKALGPSFALVATALGATPSGAGSSVSAPAAPAADDVMIISSDDDSDSGEGAGAASQTIAVEGSGGGSSSAPQGQAEAQAATEHLDPEGLPVALLEHARHLVVTMVDAALAAQLRALGRQLAARVMAQPAANTAAPTTAQWLPLTRPIAHKVCTRVVNCGSDVTESLLAALADAAASAQSRTASAGMPAVTSAVTTAMETAKAVRDSLCSRARRQQPVEHQTLLEEGAHFPLLPPAQQLIKEVLQRNTTPLTSDTPPLARMPSFAVTEAPRLRCIPDASQRRGLMRLRLPATATARPELCFNPHDLQHVKEAMCPGGENGYKASAAGLVRYAPNAPQWPIFRVAATRAELNDIKPLTFLSHCELSETVVVPVELEAAALALQRDATSAARSAHTATSSASAQAAAEDENSDINDDSASATASATQKHAMSRFLIVVVEPANAAAATAGADETAASATTAALPASAAASLASATTAASAVSAAQGRARDTAVQLLAAAHTIAHGAYSAPYWWLLPGGVESAVEYSRLALRSQGCPLAKSLHYAQRLFDSLSVHTWTAMKDMTRSRFIESLPLEPAERVAFMRMLEEPTPALEQLAAELAPLQGRAILQENAAGMSRVLEGLRVWSGIAAVLLPKSTRVTLQHLRQPKLVEFQRQQALRVVRPDPLLFNTRVAARIFSPGMLCGQDMPARVGNETGVQPVAAAVRATVGRVTAPPKAGSAQAPDTMPPALVRVLMVGFKEAK